MKNWIDIKKFHTISIKRYFVSKMDKKELSLRALLISYMTISSNKYKNEEEITKLTDKLYDFRFKVIGDIQGSYVIFAFTGSAIHPKYVNDEAYTIDKIFEAFKDLQTPLVINNSFDEKILEKAKRFVIANISKTNTYNELKSDLFMRHVMFKGTLADYDLRGNIDEIKKITSNELYDFYKKLMTYEHVTYVLGDIEDKYKFEFESTIKNHDDQNFYERSKRNKEIYFRKAKTIQSHIKVVYDTKIYAGEDNIYPLMLLNHALGGSYYSNLFRLVREKYGLCYLIDSLVYGASGTLVISACIKKKDLEKTLEKIDETIDTVLDNFNLDAIKKYYILQFKASYDAPGAYFSEMFRKDGFPKIADMDYYVDKINSVTLDDIKEVLKKLTKENRTVCVYGGDLDE